MSSETDRREIVIEEITRVCKLPNNGKGLFIYRNHVCYTGEGERDITTGPVATPEQIHGVAMINILMRGGPISLD